MAAIHIDGDLCKGCELCIHYCPKDVFGMTQHVNRKGYNVMGVSHPENCTRCRLCQRACPDLAILVEDR